MKRLCLIPTFAAGLVTATPAVAQIGDCAPREVLLQTLKQNFNEEPVNFGVTAKGELLEILASPGNRGEKRTWTILISIPNGPTCVASHGDGWESIEQLALEPRV